MANNNVKQVICRHYIQSFKPDSTSTCNYGVKCFKYHPTREDWREMNKNMSPCFEYCATGKCTGHDGQGCNFAKNTEDYKEACEKRGKVVDPAVVLMLEQGAEKEKKAAEAAKPETPAPNPSHELAKAKSTVGEILYKQAMSILTDNDNAGYNQVMKDFPMELPANRLAGKLVGMLLEGLDLDELINLTTTPAELNERMAEGVEVLYAHSKKPAE
jgi:hypothetical protein